MQELDCLSKELSDAPVVTKELIDAWDLLKPYLSNRSKIVRHNAIRAFAKFAYLQMRFTVEPKDTQPLFQKKFTAKLPASEAIKP